MRGARFGTLLDLVMFVGELFSFAQLPEGFIDVFHGGDAVTTPFSAGVFEIVAGALQRMTSSVDLARHVALRSAGKECGGWGRDHEYQ
jgi:hypothetical protein